MAGEPLSKKHRFLAVVKGHAWFLCAMEDRGEFEIEALNPFTNCLPGRIV